MRTFDSVADGFQFYRQQARQLLLLEPLSSPAQLQLERIVLTYSKLIYAAPFANFLRVDFALANHLRTAQNVGSLANYVADSADFLALFALLYTSPFNDLLNYLNDPAIIKHRDKIIALAFLEQTDNPQYAQQINSGLIFDSVHKIRGIFTDKSSEAEVIRFAAFFDEIRSATVVQATLHQTVQSAVASLGQRYEFDSKLATSELRDILLPPAQREALRQQAATVWDVERQGQIVALTKKVRRELERRKAHSTVDLAAKQAQERVDAEMKKHQQAISAVNAKAAQVQKATQQAHAMQNLASVYAYQSAMASMNMGNFSQTSHSLGLNVTWSTQAGGALTAKHDIYKGGMLHTSGSQQLMGPQVQYRRIQEALSQPKIVFSSQLQSSLTTLNSLLETNAGFLDQVDFPELQLVNPYADDKRTVFRAVNLQSTPTTLTERSLQTVKNTPTQVLQSYGLPSNSGTDNKNPILSWVFNTALSLIGIGTAEAMPLFPAPIAGVAFGGMTGAPIAASGVGTNANSKLTASFLALFKSLKQDTMSHARDYSTTALYLANKGNGCNRLQNLTEQQLAHEYHVIATNAVDSAILMTGYRPDKSVRGTHIHTIAQGLAEADKEFAQQCSGYDYPFAIETCYKNGYESSMIFGYLCAPGSTKPDLYSQVSGWVLDHKTGAAGTTLARHEKNAVNVPIPLTGVVTSADVTPDGVKVKFSSPVFNP